MTGRLKLKKREVRLARSVTAICPTVQRSCSFPFTLFVTRYEVFRVPCGQTSDVQERELQQAIQASLEEAEMAGIGPLASPAHEPHPAKRSPLRAIAPTQLLATSSPAAAAAACAKAAPDVHIDADADSAGGTQPVLDPFAPGGTAADADAELGDDSYADACCMVCHSNDGANDTFLLCDGCDGGYHLACTTLAAVPEGNWYCAACAQARG